MTQDEWIHLGVDKGWCTPTACDTHEGVPMTEEEMEAWEEGWDPCIHVVRLLAEGEVVGNP